MAKIPAAQARLLQNVFICKKCGTKARSNARKIIEGKVKCRNCAGKAFRQKRRK